MVSVVLENTAHRETEPAFELRDGINICDFFIHEANEHSM